jgi:hypothetical protein
MTRGKRPQLTLEEALSLRLGNGKTIGDASADELAAEAARLTEWGEEILAGAPYDAGELARLRLLAEAFKVIDEAIK